MSLKMNPRFPIYHRLAMALALSFSLFRSPFAFAEKIPVGGGANGVDGWQPVSAANVAISSETGAPGLKLHFQKSSEERRLIVWQTVLTQTPASPRSLAARVQLRLTQGKAPRLAAVFYDQSGGAWFTVSPQALTSETPAEVRLSLNSLRPAEFSAAGNSPLRWAGVKQVWFGLVCDGPATGELQVSSLQFTDESYHPDRPFKLAAGNASSWNVGQDPAVKSDLTASAGNQSMRFNFTFPGGRHMYAVPALAMPAVDLEGYQNLRFAYRATLPSGLMGLLVALQKREGGQFYFDPPPPASADWKTITIPISAFKLAPWSKDATGKLSLDQVSGIQIGTHGSASGTGGSGTIEVKDLQFVP